MSLDAPPVAVLSVGDAPELHQTFEVEFPRYGFDVVSASPGADARMQFRARKGRFAAIFTYLPSTAATGLTFIKWARALGYRGPIIVFSDHLSVADFRTCVGFGVSGFFQRSIEVEMVIAILAFSGDRGEHK
jgi:DNA-binding NtrC family response regulator